MTFVQVLNSELIALIRIHTGCTYRYARLALANCRRIAKDTGVDLREVLNILDFA